MLQLFDQHFHDKVHGAYHIFMDKV
jgi:hypothetical protein